MADTRVIAFTGGGTGGHIYPGLSVIEALRKDFDGRIVWIGSKKDSDRRTVEAAGVEYIAIPSGKLRRSFSLENLVDAFRVLAGYAAARRALLRIRPALLFSKGGYVSVPPCRAAARLGIPVFTHESDFTPGLATRLNARTAERILVAYEETRELLPAALRDRAVVVGNPVREAVRSVARGEAAGAAAQRARNFLGAPGGLPIVVFIGGSQGARQVNELVAAILPELCEKAFVVHQTGSDSSFLAGLEATRTKAMAERYRHFDYIRDELPDVMAAATVLAGRSGAGMVWEGGALGKPMVLIPLAGSGTRGDQVDNARRFERAGAATVLLGESATPAALLEALSRYIDDKARAAAAGEAAFALAGRDAASEAAALILGRMGGKA